MQIWGVTAHENVFAWDVVQRLTDEQGVAYALCRGPNPRDDVGVHLFRVVTEKPGYGDIALFETEEQARTQLTEWFPPKKTWW